MMPPTVKTSAGLRKKSGSPRTNVSNGSVQLYLPSGVAVGSGPYFLNVTYSLTLSLVRLYMKLTSKASVILVYVSSLRLCLTAPTNTSL